MNKLQKLMSAALSACMLVSAFPLAAGAASQTDCSPAGIIINGCSLNCDAIPDAVRQLCTDGNCDPASIMQILNNGHGCTGDGCVTEVPQDMHPSQPEAPEPIETQKPDDTAISVPSSPSVPIENDSEFRTAYEDEVIRLVNMERQKYGLPSLQKDAGAVKVAHIRAKEIVQVFSHTRPDGTSCFTAAAESGVSYSTAGENIAYGYADPEKVVEGWMNSEGHRKNILSSSFNKIGVGCYAVGNTLYWSQFFIG